MVRSSLSVVVVLATLGQLAAPRALTLYHCVVHDQTHTACCAEETVEVSCCDHEASVPEGASIAANGCCTPDVRVVPGVPATVSDDLLALPAATPPAEALLAPTVWPPPPVRLAQSPTRAPPTPTRPRHLLLCVSLT